MEYLNLNGKLDRRVFTKGLGLIGVGLIASTLGGCESLLKQIRERPIRRRLRPGNADVDAALAALEPQTLYGEGLGAYIALLTAGARPDRVRGAILADGPGLAGGGS